MSAPSMPDESSTGERPATRDADPGRVRHGGESEAELVSRLRVIEEQPLATRAAAYASVHEELAKRLESAPADERP